MILIQMYIPKYPMNPALELRRRLIENLPGITEAPMCAGAWKNVLGESVQEGVNVISCVVEDEMQEIVDVLLQQYKQDAAQEVVLYTVTPTTAVYI